MSRSTTITRRHALLVSFAAAAAAGVLAPSAFADDDPWPGLKTEIFGTRPIADAGSSLVLLAPDQAQDAAVVPVSFRLSHQLASEAKQITLIIDRNPSPVAATFVFGDAYRKGPDVGDRTLATRVRVDAFSRVRAVVEKTDGSLVMVSKFVIGAGGCSSPASKDLDQALASLGKSEVQALEDPSRSRLARSGRENQPPQLFRLQRDIDTGGFTPARFVDLLEVKVGDAMIMRMEGGISISENPNIRFTFGLEGEGRLAMTAKDTDGATFAAVAVGEKS